MAGRRTTRWWHAPAALGAATAVLGAGLWGLDRWKPFARTQRPAEWDELVAPLVAYVERRMGHDFTHPVPVIYLDDDAFEAEVVSDPGDLDDEDREALARDEALMRALGLISGTADLLAESNELASSAILAFYRFDDRTIVVRADPADLADEDELPVDIRVTVVHELVHALQDQLFDLDELTVGEDLVEEEALLALVEGHAVWIEDRYIDSLPDDDHDDYWDSYLDTTEDVDDASDGISAVLYATANAPYIIGPTFFAALAAEDRDLLDEVYADPPDAIDQLLLPSHYLRRDTREELAAVEVPGGSEELTRTELGPIVLYLMLSTALPPPQALHAADGWGNDQIVLHQAGGRHFVTGTIAADGTAEADRLWAGLQTWSRSRPSVTGARVQRDGDSITLSVCDPGAGATQRLPSIDAADHLLVRSYDLSFELGSDGDIATAECVVVPIYRRYALDEMFEDDEFAAFYEQLVRGCHGRAG